jgi:hypothetical protein
MSQAVTALPYETVPARASAALGKVDLWGRRGVTMLSIDEAEAMAILLAVLGLVATEPGKAPPAEFFIPASKDV